MAGPYSREEIEFTDQEMKPWALQTPTAAQWTAALRRIGHEDAATGEPFAPEMYVVDVDDAAAYTRAFLEVRPDCEPAREWWQYYNHQGVDYTAPSVQ